MKLKLRTKIVGGLMLIFMLAVAMGVFGVYTITTVNAMQSEIYMMTELSDTAERLVEAHHIWRYNLAWAFLYDRPFVGGLDPHTCIYGNWLAGDMPHWVDDAQVFALIDAVFQPHYDLHVQGGVALRLREEGHMDEALALLYDVVFPAGVESTVRISALRARYVELRNVYMGELDGFVSYANMVIFFMCVAALLFFLLLSFFITRSILVPIRGIEHVADALSKMDFTIHIQKTENDEIGDIQDELINIRDNLKKGIEDMQSTHSKDVRHQQEQRAAFEDRMHAILDASPIVSAIFDAEGNIVEVNREVENMLGIADRQAYVTDFNKFLPKHQPDGSESIQKSTEMLRKCIRDGSTRYEWTYLHSDGSLVPTEEIVHRITIDGKPHAIAYSRDLREYYRERERERVLQGKIQAMMEQLNEHVEEQSASVTTSSAATEQMIANIQSVTDTLTKNSQSVKELQEASVAGHTSLNEVVTDIQGIARESESLLEINAVMENIAGQTNLLSMNAAIEAARAGEAGKGFAVVAGEIRQLAENSSNQSKTISGVLKSIKDAIDKITRSTDVVLGKFDAIGTGVKTVAVQEDSILSAMEEQGHGSKQILQAVGTVNEVTHKVKEAARRLVETSKENMHKTDNSESKSFTDALTGIRNRKYFEDSAERELRYCVDENRNFTLIMFSVDNLRQITDEHGSGIHDDVLKILTMRARNSLKQGTLVARYSDEEFIITLPNVPQGTATKLAEQVQKKVKDAPFATRGIRLDVSISLGLASKTDGNNTLNGIIMSAEKALASAKASGSNKIASGW